MYSSICSRVIVISSLLRYIKCGIVPERFPETFAEGGSSQDGRCHPGRTAGFPLETDQFQDALGVGAMEQLGDPDLDLLWFLRRQGMVETKPHPDRPPLNCHRDSPRRSPGGSDRTAEPAERHPGGSRSTGPDPRRLVGKSRTRST